MKVVLDTNCLVSLAPEKPFHDWFWDALARGDFVLCVTTDILAEYEEILARLYSQGLAETVMRKLSMSGGLLNITVYFRMLLIRHDPDDDKFADCAFASNAHYLITHDHHFNVLRPLFFPRINVVKLKDFKQILQEEKK